MKRIMITVAYDGTVYHGWQVQPNGVTIEEKLNQALCDLTGEDIRIIGASRTDAGVHAMGNLAVFDTQSRIAPEKFSAALNARLPEDIRVFQSVEVTADFHPRHCDSKKTYEYRKGGGFEIVVSARHTSENMQHDHDHGPDYGGRKVCKYGIH